MSLASQGRWGGDPKKVYEAPTDMVMKMADYTTFIAELQETEMVLNTKEA